MRKKFLLIILIVGLAACTPAPTPPPTPIPTQTPPPTNTPNICIGATDPGARDKFSLEQITPCLNSVEKVSQFMANNITRNDAWDAKACGEICYSPAYIVYQNGVDDLHGLVTLECYFLEKNGMDAYHIGFSIDKPVGTNACGVMQDGKLTILDYDGKVVGTFDSLADAAREYINRGWMTDGGSLRTIKASQIKQITSNNSTPSLIELPWEIHEY
jgi:hypothetical protein